MKFITTPYFFSCTGLPSSAFNLDFSHSKSRPLGEDDEREQIEWENGDTGAGGEEEEEDVDGYKSNDGEEDEAIGDYGL